MKQITIATLLLGSSAIANERPNILFCIADDVSYPYLGAYGCSWVRTPNCDKAASQGLLFNNAYTPNAKSAPSRSIILTGRYSWQLEEAANHFPFFPAKFKSVVEVLSESGYHVGNTGKAWAPGNPGVKDGKQRQLIGKSYNSAKLTPATREISNIDYAENFKQFLAERPSEQTPFFFWYGCLEPHRGYEYGTGTAVGGYRPEQIDRVPSYWRDCDSVRNDMLDFAFELEHFDNHVGGMIETLRQCGELDNTIIIITADNGMPFPRIKGQSYYASNHLPLIIMWGDGVKYPGREIEEYISFVDLAPTFLQIASVDESASGMESITGESFLDILSGTEDRSRDFAILGKERHDIGRPDDVGYPIRSIRTGDYLYIYNFECDRWAAGDPKTGYLNCDAGATKSTILAEREIYPLYWQLNFGKRPTEELYNVTNDPDCIINVAEESKYRAVAKRLHKQLFKELKSHNDPRIDGKGDIFDKYQYSDPKYRNYYNRLERGEKIPTPSWILKSDEQDL